MICQIPGLFSQNSQVVINEFMASNGITIADEDGDFEDWIELYNRGDEAVSLQGYYLSDDYDNPLRWRFPLVELDPGEFLLVFASGKNRFGTELHTNFRISAGGEPLLLSDPDGQLLDYIPAVDLQRDQAFGRIPDGGAELVVLDFPTPGTSNVAPFDTELSVSHPSGFYNQPFDLEIIADREDVVIYYTTNGNSPGPGDLTYQASISLAYSDSIENNPIIEIPTNAPSTQWWFRWRPPGEKLFRGQVVRARAFRGDNPVSEEITKTYFIDVKFQERFDLPVISIVMDEEYLFDFETGLFVPGKAYEENPVFNFPWSGGNFHNRGREWEREASFFYFDEDLEPQIAQRLGVRIHGGGSRSMPLKSLRLYARESYGEEYIQYPFFQDGPDVFRRLLLRNSGQDFVRTMYMDGLTHLMIEDLDIEYQRYRPSVLFINGAYWGIINIRDRFDKHHFYLHHGVEEENLDLLEFGGYEVIEGENESYISMMNFVRNNSLKDEGNYRIVEEIIDVDNFIDYYIVKMFIATYDWPGNNIRFWRDRSIDGKWRWIYFDNDDALSDLFFDPYEHLMDLSDEPWPNPLWSTELFRNLIESEIFRQKFADAINYHLRYTFNPERTMERAYEVAEAIREEIPHHIERWGFPERFSDWEKYSLETLQFLEKRPCVFLEMSMAFFGSDFGLDSLEHCFTDTETGQRGADHIVIYPNPTTDLLTVRAQNSFSTEQIRIVDVMGRIYMTINERSLLLPGQEISLSVVDLPTGYYILEVVFGSGDGTRVRHPFIKQ
ncbi:MAG: T9SS C-terminal target domain-containing protein [Saprospirales bacterium]|nr:MAG: T9SS C-terminal target domain-containing protein [Saprospirales bacterium]